MRRIPLAMLLLATATTLTAPTAGATPDAKQGYSDCTCDQRGHWQATDPNVYAVWADGSCENQVNLRRCRELDEADPRAKPCHPGDERSIYGDPAPRLDPGRCPV